MEDYIIREIDRIGEMMVQIASRLGLYGTQRKSIPIEDVKSAIFDSGLDLNIDEVLQQENPILWLVEQKHFSDKALETFTDILMHSDTNEEIRQTFLKCSISYLDSNGYISFLLYSYLETTV